MNRIFSTMALGAALTFAACQPGGGGNVKQQAHHVVEVEKGLLLDVRSVEEFASGHLQGAVNIPVQDLARRLGEVGGKTRPVVVYCAAGPRATQAARILTEAGHTRIVDLGGMSNW